jgi:hypothetical protein
MHCLLQLNRCGTLGGSDHNKREVKNTKPTKNYMWNTVTIQYNPLIEEEWDEHFKVTKPPSVAPTHPGHLRVWLRFLEDGHFSIPGG